MEENDEKHNNADEDIQHSVSLNIYKPAIFLMWAAGYLPSSTLAERTWKKNALIVWTIIAQVVHHMSILFSIILLYFTIDQHVSICYWIVFIVSISNVGFVQYFQWYNKLLKNLILHFEKVCCSEEEHQMKIFFLVLTLVSCSLPGFISANMFINFLYKDNVLRFCQEYSVVIPVHEEKFRVNNWSIIMQFILLILAFNIFIPIALGYTSTFIIIMGTYVHTMVKYRYVVRNINYSSSFHLIEAQRKICEIERLMNNINSFFSPIAAVAIVNSIIMYCIAVHYFFWADDVPTGFSTSIVHLVFSTISVGQLLTVLFVLYVDQKSHYPVRKVYEMSAKVNPNDIEYAVQAEALAKLINRVKVHISIWKVCKVRRLSIANLMGTYFSYCILSLQQNSKYSHAVNTLNDITLN